MNVAITPFQARLISGRTAAGWHDAATKAGTVQNGVLFLDQAHHEQLLTQFQRPATPVAAPPPPAPGKMRGLGDLVHRVALPIARALGLNCVDKTTGQLKPDSRCQQRRNALNAAVPFNPPTK